MAKWILTISEHPYVKDGDYNFANLSEAETFVGDNDIQCDHIDEFVRTSGVGEPKVSYVVTEIVPASSVRLLLEVNTKMLPHNKHCNTSMAYDNNVGYFVNPK